MDAIDRILSENFEDCTGREPTEEELIFLRMAYSLGSLQARTEDCESLKPLIATLDRLQALLECRR